MDVAVDVVGADPLDQPVSLEYGQDGRLHPGKSERRSLLADELVDLGELPGAL